LAVIPERYLAVIPERYLAVIPQRYLAVIPERYLAVIPERYLAEIPVPPGLGWDFPLASSPTVVILDRDTRALSSTEILIQLLRVDNHSH
jgi:hypothetical protein